MSQANVVFVQSLYQAFGEGRVADIVAAVTPDARWEVVGDNADSPHYGVRTGAAGVQDFFTTLGGYIEFSEFTPQDFIDGGDKIVVTGTARGRVHGTGAEIADRWIHVFHLRDGKLAAFTEWDISARHAAANRMRSAA